jgi:hypothetical protein
MRSTTETLELDMSLRQSRIIYVSLAVSLSPVAVSGLVMALLAIATIVESIQVGQIPVGIGDALFRLAIGVVFVGAEYAVISQAIEANRRLKILRECPDKVVRKLCAPFQSSLFGPYH